MSIENMTNVSYFLLAVSGMLMTVASVIFFAMDIPKCWRLVLGRTPVHKKRMRTYRIRRTNKGRKYSAAEKTVLLQDRKDAEVTELLPVEELELIQDIVYTQKQ